MNGYSERREVEEVIAAVGRLASPGDVLFGVAHGALETFGLLDYANQRAAADLLAAKLETAIREWGEIAKGFVVH